MKIYIAMEVGYEDYMPIAELPARTNKQKLIEDIRKWFTLEDVKDLMIDIEEGPITFMKYSWHSTTRDINVLRHYTFAIFEKELKD